MGCPKIVPKGNLLEMVSNWQVSIGYEDNQIMTGLSGIGRLWKLLGLLFVSFDAAHALHDIQNVSMSCTIEVHQKYLLMYCAALNDQNAQL